LSWLGSGRTRRLHVSTVWATLGCQTPGMLRAYVRARPVLPGHSWKFSEGDRIRDRTAFLCAESDLSPGGQGCDPMLMPASSSPAFIGGRRRVLKPERNRGIAPVLKWAGGKAQLLERLLPLMPAKYGTYIEPFVGAGALFFAATPDRAVISDSNPELIAFYQTLRDDVDGIVQAVRQWGVDKQTFYGVRKMDPLTLSPALRAARMHYLNRTCFNGLYRVNRKGEFNVPYGGYKNPRLGDELALRAASGALAQVTILCEDYLAVLRKHARPGDFVFLDPPYVPAGQFSDFKRYTKEQFRVSDHEALAEEVVRLRDIGCYVLLTNSNVPLTRRLYRGFDCKVVPTRRNINCDGEKRFGEDLIVRIEPRVRRAPQSRPTTTQGVLLPGVLSPQVTAYPSTRFMGSKERLLADIWSVASQFPGDRVLDLFSGSGVVSYMFKAQGKSVMANDYMTFSSLFTRAMVENNETKLSPDAIDFLTHGKASDNYVRSTFKGLYFSDEDCHFIDVVRSRIAEMDGYMEKTLARASLIRACMKKRARGIFTYVGVRYDDGRRDMQISLREHFAEATKLVNAAIFDNGQKSVSLNLDASAVVMEADIVYIDPPYYSKLSDNDYIRRYHFVEGLAREWIGLELQSHTKTKKFKTYGSPFSTYEGAKQAFEDTFRRYGDSVIIVSYSSNSLPDKETMLSMLRRFKHSVEVVPVNHRYSFGNQGHKVGNANNKVSEYLFVAS
jgi:DNA adenine methylase